MKINFIKTIGIFLLIFALVTIGKICIGLNQTNDDDNMIYIPESYFIMGSNDGFKNEEPEKKVFVGGFYIDKYEVTNEDYKKFIDATKTPPPKIWTNGTYPKGKDKYPVTNVSYYEAESYAKWAEKRLPKEEEWEKAARGNDGRIFPWGNKWTKVKANCYSFGEKNELKPVGSYPEGKSLYGCYDMSGNVYEWTDTWYKMVDEINNPLNIKYKVVKGGSYVKKSNLARCSVREALPSNEGYGDVGFRCVK